MFKSELELFVAKRISVFLILLSVIALFLKNRWYILAGLIVGAVLSVFMFVSYAWIYRKLTDESHAKNAKKRTVVRSMFIFALNQIIIFPLLFLSYFINNWLFAGLIAGVVLAPIVLVVNSLTEALGITKNNFFI